MPGIVHLGIIILADIIILANSLFWHSAAIGSFALIAICLIFAFVIGQVIAPAESKLSQISGGIIILLIIMAGVSGLVYRFFGLAIIWRLSLIIILPPLATWCIAYLGRNRTASIKKTGSAAFNLKSLGWLIGCALLAGACFFILWQARTSEAIRSPWTVVPIDFFLVFFCLQFAAFIWLIRRPHHERHFGVFLGLLILSVEIGVAIIIYRLGYGFDSYIHEATEKLILQQGIVEPRPWYYLGQYGLMSLLATATSIKIEWLNRLLVPVMAIIILPWLSRFLPKHNPSEKMAVVLCLTALPLTSFIQTTPQGLANLLFLIVVAATFWIRPWTRLTAWGLTAMSLATIIIHPIAGLPALGLVILTAFHQWKGRIATFIMSLLVLPVIPLLFYWQEITRSGNNVINAINGSPASYLPWIYFANRYQPVLDFVYLYIFNLPIIIGSLSLVGIYIVSKQKKIADHWPHILLAAILFIYALTLNKLVPFLYLISYERTDFTERFFELATYTMIPFMALALRSFVDKIRQAPAAVALTAILILTGVRTAGLYATYPRYDGYAFDRGYSTSQHDLDTVKLIENEAGAPYIVLADQAVSAAALRELGFKQYFKISDKSITEQIFFYPIPTGGPLYQYYLRMVYDSPSRQTAREAGELVGVNKVYLVINDYWFDSETLIAKAKLTADSWQPVNNGKNYVFAYNFSD